MFFSFFSFFLFSFVYELKAKHIVIVYALQIYPELFGQTCKTRTMPYSLFHIQVVERSLMLATQAYTPSTHAIDFLYCFMF